MKQALFHNVIFPAPSIIYVFYVTRATFWRPVILLENIKQIKLDCSELILLLNFDWKGDAELRECMESEENIYHKAQVHTILEADSSQNILQAN